jgi:spermidine/putrescine transport system permease protein
LGSDYLVNGDTLSALPMDMNEKTLTNDCEIVLKKRTKKKDHGPIWTLSPVLFWMVCFVALPLVLVVLVSFLQRGLYGGIEYCFNLENYSRMFDPLYFKIFGSSFMISFLTTLICLVLGYPFAYFIAKSPAKFRSFLLMLVIIPFWSNSLIRTYAWIMLLRTEGIINNLLLYIGLIKEPLQLLYNETAVLIGLVYTLFPFMVLPLYSSIEKLNPSLLEAASDLGAPAWKSFLWITLPLTMPGVIAGSVLVFIPTLGYFFIPDLLGGSKTMLICNLIKNQFLTARDWPFGAALSIFLIILTLVLIGIYMRAANDKSKMEALL